MFERLTGNYLLWKVIPADNIVHRHFREDAWGSCASLAVKQLFHSYIQCSHNSSEAVKGLI